MSASALRFVRYSRWSCLLLALLVFCFRLVPAERNVHFLRFADVSETLQMFRDSGLPGSDITSSEAWDRWIREQNSQVRSRVDRGFEDSISNLILFGTSYTNLARIDSPESSVSSGGSLTDAARARVEALASALQARNLSERLQIVRDYCEKKGVPPDQRLAFFTENLKRFAAEQLSYREKLQAAERSGDFNERLSTRSTLYQSRGLSADTSLMVNYALEDTLRALLAKGAIAQGQIHRVAIIGPGLDFTNKHNGFDFYPLQTLQPFAVMESALRLQLAKPDDVEVVAMDLNPGVNAHITRLVRDARQGRSYTVQLPRDQASDWPQPASAYWEHFGEIIGKPTTPLAVPATLEGVTLRAVSISPRYASRLSALDLNVVAQRADFEPGQAFDLVVATNILVYYDWFQQALAMESISRMMNPGGIFLSNDALSSHHTQSLEYIDRHSVSYSTRGGYGDNVLAYRRR